MAGPVELIPGTTLPMTTAQSARQPEGRGDVIITRDREPPSLLEHVGDPAGIDPMARAVVDAALRHLDSSRKLERAIFSQASGQADATTGNLVLMLFEAPQGYETHLTYAIADATQKATVNPSAPSANAASWSYLAVAPPSTGRANADASTAGGLRAGMVDFAPTAAAGPMLPFRWMYNDDQAPIVWGGEALYYVQVGGSQAALAGAAVTVHYRANIYQHGLPA